MNVEIEAKLKVASFDACRDRLAAIGATRAGVVLETNHIYDDAGRTLLAAGCGLRVRSCRQADGTRPSATLTYKGPRHAAALKRREEIETAVADGDAMRAVLEALGYVEVLRFEKRRESWHHAECEVDLDELPVLGRFIEIEGPDEAAVHRVQADLNLTAADHIPQSYVAMLADHCRDNAITPARISFG